MYYNWCERKIGCLEIVGFTECVIEITNLSSYAACSRSCSKGLLWNTSLQLFHKTTCVYNMASGVKSSTYDIASEWVLSDQFWFTFNLIGSCGSYCPWLQDDLHTIYSVPVVTSILPLHTPPNTWSGLGRDAGGRTFCVSGWISQSYFSLIPLIGPLLICLRSIVT